MTLAADSVEKCIDAYLEGEAIEVPSAVREQYDGAIAAHAALKDFLEATLDSSELEMMSRPPPRISGDYEIERELGCGGMGVVYLARQKSLHRNVAIKVLRPSRISFEKHVSRFLEEARHLANLRHPNIVPVHEIGDAEGEPYFTMDFIDGEPLSAIIARGPLTPSRAVEIVRQVSLAIQHAHRQGVIHRDLKPANVLIDKQGSVFVTDFGLARTIGADSSLTQTGDVLGTPQYMSPEQARGDTKLIGEASDLHAIGLLLFEMLTGKPPFTATNSLEVVRKIASEEAPLLRKIDRRIPRDLETICLKCLQKAPAARYANANSLLVDLQRYERGEPLVARRPGVLHQLGKWMRDHWKIAAAVLITAGIAAAVAPLLIERPYKELVAWGDEELAKGNALTAATVYDRALSKAKNEEKQEVAQRIVQVCRTLDDSKLALRLALLALPHVPDASFGKHDYLVAQAIVTRQRTSPTRGGVNIWTGAPKEELVFVKTRLELALRTQLTEKQKLEAEETFAAVSLALNEGEPFVRYTPTDLATVPQGTVAELRKTLDDNDVHPWERGRAAMALGKQFLREQKKERALAEFQTALKFMRSVYPMYSGVQAGLMVGGKAPEAEECLLLQELVADIRSISPDAMAAPAGGIEFEVQGFRYPSSVALTIALEFCEKHVEFPDRGLPRNLPRHVDLRQDAPVKVRLLDGTYRLRNTGHSISRDTGYEHLMRRLQIDLDDWPTEVQIRGGVVQLPPVKLRLADEINYESPKNGEAIDLSSDQLTWKSIPNADHYRVTLMWRDEAPTSTTHIFSVINCKLETLKFADLTDLDRKQVSQSLTKGRTGGWRVAAYDANGKCIGIALEEQWFLVAGELKE
jgi:tRNA A-37 threonylcarbamoyl transferase component Bud32